jgi:hypothetical protein
VAPRKGAPNYQRGFRAGYEAATIDILRLVRMESPKLQELLEQMRPALDRLDAMDRLRAAHTMSPLARAILYPDTLPPLEASAAKAGRTKQLKRILRDEGQAAEFAALIRAGETTETARAKMGIGLVRAKRLRAIAVRLKWIRERQMRGTA